MGDGTGVGAGGAGDFTGRGMRVAAGDGLAAGTLLSVAGFAGTGGVGAGVVGAGVVGAGVGVVVGLGLAGATGTGMVGGGLADFSPRMLPLPGV